MAQGSSQVGRGTGTGRGSEQVRRELEETRKQLGDTVSSLAQKDDAKDRAKDKTSGVSSILQDKAADATQTVSSKADEWTYKAKRLSPDSATDLARENPVPAAAAGGFLAGLVIGRLLGGHKHRKKARKANKSNRRRSRA